MTAVDRALLLLFLVSIAAIVFGSMNVSVLLISVGCMGLILTIVSWRILR